MAPRNLPYRGDPRVLWLVYGSLLVPFVGPVLLAVASSVAYFRIRHTRPNFARWLNFHAWCAIGINAAAHVALLLVVRS